MDQSETIRWIRQVSEEYLRENQPGELAKLDETWEIFRELHLLEQGGVQLRTASASESVGAADLIDPTLAAILLGIVINATYDTARWTAIQVYKALKDEKFQEKSIKSLGNLRGHAREQARAILKTTLGRIHRRKQAEEGARGNPSDRA